MKKTSYLSFLCLKVGLAMGLAIASNASFAASCPPAKLVEEKIKNFHATLEHEGLRYHLNHSDFNSKIYHLSQTTFSGAELSVTHKAPGGSVVSCHYTTFDGKKGEIVLQSNSTPKNTKPEGAWVLEEGVHSCDAKKDESAGCSFNLIDENNLQRS